jgi:hypothetical protein
VPAPLQNAPRPLKFRIGSQMIRDALFPIYGPEVKKFFSMGMIKFLVVFVLTITRDVKDTLIVTSCGAESIAFLKVYGVLPAAAAFTIGAWGRGVSVLVGVVVVGDAVMPRHTHIQGFLVHILCHLYIPTP